MELELAYVHPSDLLLLLLRNPDFVLEERVTDHEMRDNWLFRGWESDP